MSIDAKPEEFDAVSSRFYDNRSPKEVPYVPDPVNKPEHYTVGPVEVIDIIKQQQGTAIEFHYEAAVLKYVLRWRYKNGVEDLKKAAVYLGWLISEKEGG
jgi:hypothetical protein